MSDICCGDSDPTPPPPQLDEDDCCATSSAPFVEHGEQPPWWRDRTLALPAASGLLWVLGTVLVWTGQETTGLITHAAGLAAGGWTFVPGTLRRLLRGRRRLGVGLLMTIAALGAVLLGHVSEAAALAFLFSIAEALEDRAMNKARTGLRGLLSLIPETARVSRGAIEQAIPAEEVRAGDLLLVGAGDRVATDAVVVTGDSWLDTAAITGESIPADVGPGAAAPAGSVNGSGALTVRATADGRDNSLTQIVHLVEQAHATKGDRARLADRIAAPLVPLVLIIAGLVAAFGFIIGDPQTWVERALVVLVAASPCAMAIAVPVTVISAIGSASKLGVVIKSGAAFEELGTIGHVAFDKTGTLTRNRPEVIEAHAGAGHTADEVLGLAAALEVSSNHPLARAIVAAARPVSAPARAEQVREHPGHGLTGVVAGSAVRVGSPQWVDAGELAPRVTSLAQRGMSIIVVDVDSQPIGVIGLRDELRPEAAEAVTALTAQGISSVMLTGDNEQTAHALAQQAGISEVHADQLPTDKAARVLASSQHVPTAMIGDGINDAPALASATVGIAMGATGSAAAVESADVAFTGSDLRLIPQVLAHAKRGRGIMTGNIALALAIIVVLFPLALFGVLGLAAVVLVHELAEVLVILNGLRAARLPPQNVPVHSPPKRSETTSNVVPSARPLRVVTKDRLT